MKTIVITATLLTAILFSGCKKTTYPPYVGTWVMNGTAIMMNPNNTYTINNYPTTETGTYTATASQLGFTANTPTCGSNQTGKYSYIITYRNQGASYPNEYGVLTLTVINDPCGWRSANLPGTYTQQSEP